MCYLCAYAMGGTGAGSTGPAKYKFYPESFDPKSPDTKLINLEFEFLGEKVIANSTTTFINRVSGSKTPAAPLRTIRLDSQDLKVESISVAYPEGSLDGLCFKKDIAGYNSKVAGLSYIKLTETTKGSDAAAGTYFVDSEENAVIITLPRDAVADETFILNTLTIATPTNHILEGLYFDNKAELPNITSQCQQLGCQRIFSVIDDMRTKCFWSVSITGNSAYTSFLTNGDLSVGYYDAEAAKNGQSVARPQPAAPYKYAAILPEPAFERVTVKYESLKDPMAPYLFFLSVANYIRYSKLFEYPSGDKFELELLLYPGSILPGDAAKKLHIVEEAIMYTHLNLGYDAANYNSERARLWELVRERDALLHKQGVVVSGTYRSINGQALKSSEVDADGNVVFPASASQYVGSNEGLTAEEEAKLASIRAELKSLIASIPQPGYVYKDSVYSEVHVKTSQVGGMENRNKTVIVGSAICLKRYQETAAKLVNLTTDLEAVYLYGVSAHEFYHALNGSEVTGATPFEIYLNEAVTVQTGERLFSDSVFGADYNRLKQLTYALTPGSGPLAIDEAPGSMAIIPLSGFNSAWDLITAMTYSKAPEVCNMIRLMLGKDKFNKALANYHKKFSHGNATTTDWLACMEEQLGGSLKNFAQQWLYRSGHPTVRYSTSYADGVAKISVEQVGYEGRGDSNPWEFPIDYALVKDGRVLAEGLYLLTEASAVIEVAVSEEPDFASVGRNWSFFGRVKCLDSMEVQEKQALSDPDAVCRFLAFRGVSDQIRTEMLRSALNGEQISVPKRFIDLFARILLDREVPLNVKQQILLLPQTVDDSSLAVHYWQLSDVVGEVYASVVSAYKSEILAFLAEINTPESMDGDQLTHMHHRSVKGLIFAMLGAAVARGVSVPEFVPAITDLLYRSCFITDKINALNIISTLTTSTSVPRVISDEFFNTALTPEVELMTQPGKLSYYAGEESVSKTVPVLNPTDKALCYAYAKKVMTGHPDTVSTFFTVSLGTPEGLAGVLASSAFEIQKPDHARTVCRVWAANRKLALLTKEGLAATGMLLTKVASVNEMSSVALIQAFSDASRFGDEVKTAVVATLTSCYDELCGLKKASITKAIKDVIDACNK